MLNTLADAYPTPFFAYDADLVRQRCTQLRDAFAPFKIKLYYAVKANDHPAVVAIAAEAGIGACLVSRGEMQRASAGGVPYGNMLMNGVGKTDDEIEFALTHGIGQLNVEGLPEMPRIAAIARKLGKRAVICTRINPEITANAYSHNTTARRTDKFGLLVEDLPQIRALVAQHPELDWRGFSCHIGSQIEGVDALAASYRVMADLFRAERQTQPQFDRLDLGGGFGVPYTPEAVYAQPADYARLINEVAGDLIETGVTIQMEPGRFIAAEAGHIITRVVQVKDSGGNRFVIVDAAMNNLIRPAMYGARHSMTLLRQSSAAPQACTIAGPICESGDVFGRDYMLAGDIAAGDFIAIGNAGAYGIAMSSMYNARDRVAEVMFDEAGHRLIRRALSAAEFDALTLVDEETSSVRARA